MTSLHVPDPDDRGDLGTFVGRVVRLDQTAVVRLCTRLTWVLAVPCIVRVLVQGPIWLAAHAGSLDTDTAIAMLGTLKIIMGWPLQLATLAGMVWLLARNSTPLEPVRD